MSTEPLPTEPLPTGPKAAEPVAAEPTPTEPVATGTGRRLAGSATPLKRLAVSSLKLRAPRLPSTFPWTAPTWPSSVPRTPVRRRLGTNYDTAWARQPSARYTRLLLTELFTRPVMTVLAAPRISGLDRLDHLHGPVIFVANHTSHADTPLLLSSLPPQWRHHTAVGAAADYFFDTKWKAALFAWSLNAFPIERRRVSRDSAMGAAALLNSGWSFLLYPEGGRSPDGWGQPHQAGAAWLAVRTGRPIVPVHVAGTGRILPKGSARLHPALATITFGRPLSPTDDARSLANTVEQAVAVLADEASTDWWSAARRAAEHATPDLRGPDASPWRRAWVLSDRAQAVRPGARVDEAPPGAPRWTRRRRNIWPWR